MIRNGGVDKEVVEPFCDIWVFKEDCGGELIGTLLPYVLIEGGGGCVLEVFFSFKLGEFIHGVIAEKSLVCVDLFRQ